VVLVDKIIHAFKTIGGRCETDFPSAVEQNSCGLASSLLKLSHR
jgi:hypothetical protein